MNARIAAVVVVAVLLGGAIAAIPMTDVSLTNRSENFCVVSYTCPTSPAADGGDQATAERRVIDGYLAKQAGCTPEATANPQSVSWEPPGFVPAVGGSGNVRDADASLGGHFAATYINGRWHIDYQDC
ncbi:integrase [Mycobacterium vicinigordonae]|uniref:Integrase n=1 Tax=Mycobacterium vicinigordonae TaxID=1719132 RepID=A0A7D6DX41_9MYCO|nr:integrase [Mycobacterium vicinigordonae]QLL06964.1 integrase [Mycobacterium vicinigordonae]